MLFIVYNHTLGYIYSASPGCERKFGQVVSGVRARSRCLPDARADSFPAVVLYTQPRASPGIGVCVVEHWSGQRTRGTTPRGACLGLGTQKLTSPALTTRAK